MNLQKSRLANRTLNGASQVKLNRITKSWLQKNKQDCFGLTVFKFGDY